MAINGKQISFGLGNKVVELEKAAGGIVEVRMLTVGKQREIAAKFKKVSPKDGENIGEEMIQMGIETLVQCIVDRNRYEDEKKVEINHESVSKFHESDMKIIMNAINGNGESVKNA